jgi:peptidyl-prolyl cis-trans isomerase SDCCAG10
VEVLHNPFDDIVPRVKATPTPVDASAGKSRQKRKKNFKLLSFGDEAEEEVCYFNCFLLLSIFR